jgi:hypothetical protein
VVQTLTHFWLLVREARSGRETTREPLCGQGWSLAIARDEMGVFAHSHAVVNVVRLGVLFAASYLTRLDGGLPHSGGRLSKSNTGTVERRLGSDVDEMARFRNVLVGVTLRRPDAIAPADQLRADEGRITPRNGSISATELLPRGLRLGWSSPALWP